MPAAAAAVLLWAGAVEIASILAPSGALCRCHRWAIGQSQGRLSSTRILSWQPCSNRSIEDVRIRRFRSRVRRLSVRLAAERLVNGRWWFGSSSACWFAGICWPCSWRHCRCRCRWRRSPADRMINCRSRSWLAQKPPMQWYLDALYLNHGYSFFAPEPGIGYLIHYDLLDGRGGVVKQGSFPGQQTNLATAALPSLLDAGEPVRGAGRQRSRGKAMAADHSRLLCPRVAAREQ